MGRASGDGVALERVLRRVLTSLLRLSALLVALWVAFYWAVGQLGPRIPPDREQINEAACRPLPTTAEEISTTLGLMRRLDMAEAYASRHTWATGAAGLFFSRQDASGSAFRGWSWTPGYKLAEIVRPVRIHNAVKNLIELRGVPGLGARCEKVSHYMAYLLMAADFNLDVGVSKDQFIDEVRIAKRHLARHRSGVSVENPINLSELGPATIPDGAFFRYNGEIYSQKAGSGWPQRVDQES